MSNATAPNGPFRVFYPDLGGGRNTRRGSHKLNRNELYVSINGWLESANTYSKRPGNTSLIATPGVGSNLPANGMAVARYGDNTSVIVQSGTTLYACGVADSSWTTIATGLNANAKILQASQLYDGGEMAFIVNGLDVPRKYPGSGTASTATVPLNHSGGASITPSLVTTVLSFLVYAGEPTEPSGVYISDPSAPESFTYGGQLPGAAFIPYLIGHNDGAMGGKITGIMPLGNSLMVYKQSAIYRMDNVGYYGDVGPWQVTMVSASTGLVAPKSLVSFDTFHAFMGIDGIYTCNGQEISQRPISDNNPDLFDGPTAAIADRTTAVGVRFGSRYMVFYDNGGV